MSRLRSAFDKSLQVVLAVFCISSAVLAQAPSGNVVISANTTWPTASYSVTSLTVQSGAILTVGGGSTVTVANGVTVSGNSSIVLQSINNTAQVNGAWAGAGVTLQAGSVQVDAGSSINADGQGYVSNAGPGGGVYGSGGSYGGLGGNNTNQALIYGSALTPVDLGSGGGAAQYNGSNGGGIVRLIVSGALTNNGTISANGGAVQPALGGGGAGGAVYVTTATLTGSGTFTANGGANTIPTQSGSPAGGGGRVAIYYGGPTNFTGFATSTASGGVYTGQQAGYAGSNGTSIFVNTSSTNPGLSVYQAFSIPANSVVSYDSIAVQNGAVLTIGGGSTVTVANGVTVTGNSSIVMQGANNTGKVNGAWAGVGVTLQAGSLQVDAGSSITADAQGYLSSARKAEDGGASGGSGGSYGGLGGYSPGPIYGAASAPVDLGSGGASAQYVGSNGGGAIRLIVSGTLTNNGTISANGQDVLPNQGGAGAGGSVYVTTATLAGSGSFTANGGSNTTPTLSGSAAAGGGRVAVYYAGPTSFSGFATSKASGGVYTGQQTGYAGTDGTAVFVDTSVPNGNVNIYQSGFQIPANSTAQYNSITIANGAAVTIGSGSTIAVANNLSVGGGATLTVGGGSIITVANNVTVTGNSSIVLQGVNNTGKINGAYVGAGVTLQAGSVQVDLGSSINADGQGYLSSARKAEDGGASGGSGGSYGGLGGYNPGPIYGSASAPVDLGSGGAGAQYNGSNGGGAIRLIVSGILTNNGTISSNGQPNIFCTYGGCGGGGAGGAVYVTTATLAGSGSFTANGGSNTIPSNNGSAAGGGGRVAVYYVGPTSFTGFPTSTASGGAYTGQQAGYAGANGTSIFVDTSVPNGNATVYQHYEVPANATLQYNGLNVTNGASVTLGGGSQLAIKQALRVTGAITALSTNNTASRNGKWIGQGVVIAAGSVQIDATGTINADAQGYPQNAGPGAGSYVNGGSYGGQGAGAPAASVYGSTTAPLDLGSGGSSGQNTGGGSGGGAIELLAGGTLTNNGVISANGGSLTNSGYGGGGSGGSIYVQANSIQGSGSYSANGGSNLTPNPAGGGGGGGRISINYITNNGVTRSMLTVRAGSGAPASSMALATDGTISFVRNAGLQWLQPKNSAVHDTVNLEWFTDTGIYTTVNAAGPQTSIIATGGPGLSLANWQTTAIPDGAYELRLAVADATGEIGRVSNYVVVNNSVRWVSGTLTADTHWMANHVYAIDGDLIIPSGVTLTIDPGTVVKSLENYQIVVQSGGTLTALGNSSNNVIFTTFDDSTAGGDTSFGTGVPQPGEWGGISVNTGGTLNTNTNTFVRYGHGAVGTSITSNTTLYSSQVYEISGNLIVTSGSSLTIQPGTVIKFDAGAGITVNPGAALFANGTLAQPIYFTSINDQSVGANLISQANPNATLVPPAPGDWNNIAINGTATFNFAHILYGGGPIPTVAQTGMIQTGGAATTTTVANSTLAYSYYIGIEADAGTLTISNSVFYANQDRAVNNFATTHIVNSTFDGNAAGPFNHGGSMDIENSVITGFTNTQFGGVGGAMTNFANNDVYTATAGVPNYIGLADQTGINGNISAAPVYMDATHRDYRPTYGSPLIDAGNGTVANYSLTDAFNDPRYNAPLVTAKHGTADVSGNYPDIGAFEFVQSAPSDLDLTSSAVQGPASAIVGSQVTVNWTVTNVGVGTVYGPWHDAVYLVRNPGTNPVEIYAGEVLSGQGVVLGPGSAYSGTATITIPGTIVGQHSWEVKTNVRGEVFEGANTANNKAVSLNPVQIDVPTLTAGSGPVSGRFAGVGQPAYYKVAPSATQATNVQLALLSPATGSVQLFVGGGYVPSPQHYDYQQVEFNSATATVVIPSGSAQTYYITAYPQVLAAPPTAFTITASASVFSLSSVSPSRIVAAGDATLTFVGGGFTSNTTFKLVGSSSGTAYSASSVFLSDSSHAQVTFPVSQFPIDQYTAEAIDGSTVTLVNAVYLLQNIKTTNVSANGTLQTFLEVPQAFRYGFPSLVTLHYTNISGSDLAAPMMSISSQMQLAEIAPECDGCSANLATQYGNAYTAGLVMGINPTGPAGILPPGASGSISFLATATIRTDTTFDVSTQTLAPIENAYVSNCDLEPVGTPPPSCPQFFKKTGAYATAADFCGSLTPSGASAAGYTRACMLFFNKAGFSYIVRPAATYPDLFGNLHPAASTGDLQFEGFNKALADDATALSSNGIYEYDVQRLLAYEFQNDGAQDFVTRYHQGAYGYGASHPFDIAFSLPNGTPVLSYPDGSTREFSTPSPTLQNVYLGTVGDYGTVSVQPDSSALLTEPDGTIYHFLTNGKGLLDYIQDRTGNRIQMTYTGKLLTSVADALGNTVSFQYDANGHITSTTDPVGRVTTYAYTTLADTQKSTFLISVTDASGTTSITWNMGGSHGVGYIDDSCVTTYCEPAIGITSIAYPDGSHTYFTYDAAGRLTGSSRDNGAEALTYTYNSNASVINGNGSVTVADALGKTTTTATDANGLPIAVTDPLGNISRLRYDAEGKVVATLGPLGDSTSFGYDNSGNGDSLILPAGGYLSSSFGVDGLTTSFTDPIGGTYGFTYDSNASLGAQSDPSGQKVVFTNDGKGNPLTRTNRRGQTTTFTYTASGQLASTTMSNGVQTTYTYDPHNNIQSVTTPAGTTRYSYDAADRVTGVSNPDGTALSYTYNAGGQLTSLRDSTGFTTNYQYDAAARLSKLTDGSGNTVVTYTYDSAGHLITKSLGNGASTSIGYDASGNKTSVIHYSPGNAVLGEYDYSYNANGDPIAAKTPTGNLTFGYDLNGQLTSANTPAGTTQYDYDDAGNRTSVTSNAGTVTYTPNNLNQYTSVKGVPYTYDADGNLVSDGIYTYTYDDLGQMLSATSAADTWVYTYDGLGERSSSTHNGTTTRYLNDPTGSGNVVATFNGTGNLLSHYVYGYDLTSTVSAAGTASYYHFDATGNTTQMTGPSGTVVNNYVYLPFGERVNLAASVSNPFTYSGSSGALDDGSGLYFMRKRSYSPVLGRFVQQDPAGLSTDPNLYRYALNSPVEYTDPSGYDFVQATTDSKPVHVFNAVAPIAQTVLTAVTKDSPLSQNVNGFTTVVGVTSTTISLGNNIKNGDKLGIIHDLGLETAAVVDAIPGLDKVPGVGKVLKFVAHNASTIDEVSMSAGKRFFNWYYEPPSPFTNRLPTRRGPRHPCSTCLFKPGKKTPGKVQGSIDPNGKLTSGFGDQGFVPAGVPITYTIYFENQPTATLPAQKVVVTDALAANLDWSTVELNQVNFNNVTLTIPDGTQTYRSQARVSSDSNPVSVSAALNPATGVITWTMQSVDPITGGSPANPLAGFLPPNGTSDAGVGSVVFTVQPKAGLTNATAITNQGSIVFDVNAPILTNTVTNTIDSSTVTSAVASLPATFGGTSLTVSWSGDDGGGSGIASYDIYVSTDSGPYMLWLSGTTLTTSSYPVYAGHTFSFVSLAVNNVGIAQTVPGAAQTVTVTTNTSVSTPVVTVTPASASISASQSLSVAIAVTGNSVPTGTVTLTSGGYTSGANTLTSGSATIVIPAGALSTGLNTLTVVYAPDSAASSQFSSATGTASVTVAAVVTSAQVSVGTLPVGQSFSVDGVAYATPQSFTWTVGSVHSIATTSPQTTGGVQQTYSNWSDGGALSHNVTATSGAATYTATFNTSYLLSLAHNPAAGGTVAPVTGTFYPAGTSVSLTATPATGYSFTNWTGPVANSTAATTTITMNAPQTVTGNFTLIPVPVVSLSPTSLTFTTTAGTPSAVQTVQLSNTGTGVLSISGISIGGTGASAFSQTNTCGTSVPAGANCTISIAFTSSSAGSFTGTLSVASNATGTAPSATLSGTATAAPTFTIGATPASQTVSAGGTATYVLNLTPQGGAFTNSINLTATGLPSGATATFSPASVTPGASAASSTLTIRVPAVIGSLHQSDSSSTVPVLAMLGCVMLATRRRLRMLGGAVLMLALLGVLPVLIGCGSSSPPSKTSTITVTATSASQSQTTTVILTVQ